MSMKPWWRQNAWNLTLWAVYGIALAGVIWVLWGAVMGLGFAALWVVVFAVRGLRWRRP